MRRTKCHQGSHQNGDPTNHNVLSSDASSRDSENPSSEESESESDKEDEMDQTKYTLTSPDEWHKIGVRRKGCSVDTMPFAGGDKSFSIKISEDELMGMMDQHGDLRFDRVFDWLLPGFDEQEDISFYDFLAARMRNYMIYIINEMKFKPEYYDPHDHIAWFLGCHMAWMLRGFPIIEDSWMLREPSLDNWDEEEMPPWKEVYADEKYEPSEDGPRCTRRFEHIDIENGFNKRWNVSSLGAGLRRTKPVLPDGIHPPSRLGRSHSRFGLAP